MSDYKDSRKKLLLIDGQVFQTAAWDRGMGKYSLQLLKYLLLSPNYPYTGTKVIFSNNIELTPQAEEVINRSMPKVEKVYLPLEVPADPAKADIVSMSRANKDVLNTYLQKEGVTEFDQLIPSLFLDQVCCVFADKAQEKILIFYDLIPLQYIERYGALAAFPNYLKRFKTLFEASCLLAISQTVADDAVLNLGMSTNKVVNIDGAPIERASSKSVKPSGVSKNLRYILMPTGNEIRKNNLRGVRAFEKYRMQSGDDIKLILTSYFDEGTKKQLQKESDNLIFTGNVSEEELRWLFEHMQTLLFVPEYEGLGLPILEAAEVNRPIVCSNISVFNEIALDSFFYCNHLEERSIANAIAEALSLDADRQKKISRQYIEILYRYTWPKTAEKAIAAIENRPHDTRLGSSKPKLAVLAPNPSGYSDVGKRMVQMHPSLSRYFEIDYYLEHGTTTHKVPRTEYLSAIAPVYGADSFDKKRYSNYDAVLYHLGNSEFHVDTIKNALTLPGIAIVHDTYLTNIFEGELLAHGYISKERFAAEQKLDEVIKTRKTAFLTSIVNRQLGLALHSRYAKEAVEKLMLASDIPTALGNLPVPTPKYIVNKLKTPQKVIGFAGIIHPAKGLDIVELIARLDQFSKHRIRIFGLSLVPEETIRRLQAYPNVTVDTNVTDLEFMNLLKELDVLVNFRKEYRGEASAATLEAMRFGVVPIVRKVGWYDELPESVALKATDQEEVVSQLTMYLELDENSREQMARAAHDYVLENHSHETYAEVLAKLVTSSSEAVNVNTSVRRAVLEGTSAEGIKKILSDD